MAYGTADLIAFALFVILAVAAVIAEVMWLVRSRWSAPGKAAAYVLLTDGLGIFVGIGTFFAAFGILMMMALGGSGQGGASPEAAYWAVAAFGLLFPPMFLFSLKRVFLLIFGIRAGRSAWLYSAVLTAIFGFGVFLPPVLLFWALHRIL